MYIKKTITLPSELEKDVEKYLIGRHYANLSEVIRDGLRKVLKEYSKKESIERVAELYKKGKISLRQAAEFTGLTLRETLDEFGKRGVYIHYGKEELIEDIA